MAAKKKKPAPKPKRRKGVCKSCGAGFYWIPNPSGGSPPTTCPKHRPSKHLKRTRKAILDTEGEEGLLAFEKARDPLKFGHQSAILTARRAALPEYLAVGLHYYPKSPKLAAAYVGIDWATDEEISAAAKVARQKHKDLTESNAATIGRIQREAMTLMSLRLRTEAWMVPQGQLADKIKQIAQANDLITGGQGQVYSEIKVELSLPTEKEAFAHAQKVKAQRKKELEEEGI